MIAGYLGSVLKNHYVALLRIRDEITKAAVFATVTCAVRLAAFVAGDLAGGLAGVSVALLVVMSTEGGYAIPALRGALKGDSTAVRGNQAHLCVDGAVTPLAYPDAIWSQGHQHSGEAATHCTSTITEIERNAHYFIKCHHSRDLTATFAAHGTHVTNAVPTEEVRTPGHGCQDHAHAG